jgi:hypothetical protein
MWKVGGAVLLATLVIATITSTVNRIGVLVIGVSVNRDGISATITTIPATVSAVIA